MAGIGAAGGVQPQGPGDAGQQWGAQERCRRGDGGLGEHRHQRTGEPVSAEGGVGQAGDRGVHASAVGLFKFTSRPGGVASSGRGEGAVMPRRTRRPRRY